jgi:hypothetical protein
MAGIAVTGEYIYGCVEAILVKKSYRDMGAACNDAETILAHRKSPRSKAERAGTYAAIDFIRVQKECGYKRNQYKDADHANLVFAGVQWLNA